MAVNLREYNARQAKQAEAFADALDHYLASAAAHRAECNADADRPAETEQDMQALQLTYHRRNQAAYALAARMQDLAGIEFTVHAERV